MMRVPKRRSNRHFPIDLLPEILSRLSVKSLLRFRCISNSWLTLIDNPKFALLHLTRFKNSGDSESQLFAQIRTYFDFCESIEYELWCSETFTTTAKLDLSSSFHGSEYDIVVSVFDGLFILSDSITGEVKLCNPSIRKSRLIPKCSEIHSSMIVVEFGLGFSSAINDYKYVTMAHTLEQGLKFFAVYTLGTNSWKKIEFQSRSLSPFFCKPVGSIKHVCVRGVLYAINEDYNLNLDSFSEDSYLNVVSFDLDSDRFGSFSLPYDDDPMRFQYGVVLLTVGDNGRSLALVQVTYGDGYIWVRQATTWAKCFSFDFTLHAHHNLAYPWFLYRKTNGELLVEFDKVLTLINLETKKEKAVPKTCEMVIAVWPYTESLMMLN